MSRCSTFHFSELIQCHHLRSRDDAVWTDVTVFSVTFPEKVVILFLEEDRVNDEVFTQISVCEEATCTKVLVHNALTVSNYGMTSLSRSAVANVQDNLSIFDEVLKGNADVFVTESAETLVQQRLRPGLCGVNPDKPLQYGEMAYLLPRGDTVTKEYVDQWLHLIKANGEYQRIAARWLN